MTTTQYLPIDKAIRNTHKEREVSYIWRTTSQEVETLEHTGEKVGVQVELEFRHDKRNKQLIASLYKAHYKDGERGFLTIFISPFDHKNYPAITLRRTPISRYTDKALAEFEKSVLAELNTLAETSEMVRHFAELISQIA